MLKQTGIFFQIFVAFSEYPNVTFNSLEISTILSELFINILLKNRFQKKMYKKDDTIESVPFLRWLQIPKGRRSIL